MKKIGGLVWAIGFGLVMVGCLVRGPALGIGATIEQPRWQDDQLEFEFGGVTYQVTPSTPTETPPIIHTTAHYTTPLADWDSILLLGQDLEVRAVTGEVLYQTNTTRLRLDQPAVADWSVGEVADGLVGVGTVACLIGPLLVMRRGRWLVPALWVAIVAGYLVG